jgi:hypothetical protein
MIAYEVYAKTEKHRYNCECRATAKRFYKDQAGLDAWIEKVSLKRGHDAAYRLKKGVDWLIDSMRKK